MREPHQDSLRDDAPLKPVSEIRRPVLSRGARYRWDAVREQHQIVFPEGLLVLNETGAAIVRQCDGRSTEDLICAIEEQFEGNDRAADVHAFLHRLTEKGLLCDAAPAALHGDRKEQTG